MLLLSRPSRGSAPSSPACSRAPASPDKSLPKIVTVSSFLQRPGRTTGGRRLFRRQPQERGAGAGRGQQDGRSQEVAGGCAVAGPWELRDPPPRPPSRADGRVPQVCPRGVGRSSCRLPVVEGGLQGQSRTRAQTHFHTRTHMHTHSHTPAVESLFLNELSRTMFSVTLCCALAAQTPPENHAACLTWLCLQPNWPPLSPVACGSPAASSPPSAAEGGAGGAQEAPV